MQLVLHLAVCVAVGVGSGRAFAQQPERPGKFAIALHGGAGLEPEKLSEKEKQDYHASLKKAIEVGKKILADGGTAHGCRRADGSRSRR